MFGVEEAKSNKDREETGGDCLRIQKKNGSKKRARKEEEANKETEK